jgi:two-component system osmolarity sensor histidine kinase EnvZ
MDLLRMVAANARRAGADVELAGPDEMHVKVRRDAFARCVTNLVGNAARHGTHVMLTAVPSRLYVEIFVDDDGPGIPESLREAVFRPFFRAESSRNRATGGIGLGLTIARDILRGQGGEITLLTSPQGGLRARIKLPR